MTFHQLSVARIDRQTQDAVSITFNVPSALKDTFGFTPGQYITLELPIGNEKVRRAYSMSSAPHENELTVTVKAVKNGKMSSYLNSQLKAGDVIDVMQPQGRFIATPDIPNRRTFYMVGGGSGITPLFSIAKAILEQEPKSVVHLLYGNQDEDSIIFKAQLDELERKFAGQITVEHILSKPKEEKSGGMFSFMKKGTISWKGLVGMPDMKTIEKWIDRNPAESDAFFYTCGPMPMMQNLEKVTQARGVAKDHFFMEVFDASGAAKPAAATGGGTDALVKGKLNGKNVEVSVPAGQTILDAFLKQGHDAPFSCKSGACSTCIAKVVSGSVTMDNCFALDDDEVAKGYILTCQAKCATSDLELNFDV